jgi:hypothetical protein
MVLHGLTGNQMYCTTAAGCAYIADNVPVNKRTFEMNLFGFWSVFGMTFGNLATGFAIKNMGYTIPLLAIAAVQIILIIYVIFLVPSFGSRLDVMDTSTPSSWTVIFSWPNFKNIVTKTMKVIFHAHLHKTEIRLMVLVFALSSSASHMAYRFVPVYSMGYPLCWRAQQLGIFNAVGLAIHSLTATITTFLYQRTTWSLYWLMFMGTISGTTQVIIYGVAKHTYVMFIAVWSLECSTHCYMPQGVPSDPLWCNHKTMVGKCFFLSAQSSYRIKMKLVCSRMIDLIVVEDRVHLYTGL